MRLPANCLVVSILAMFGVGATAFGDAIDFTVDQAQSNVMVTITLDTPVGADTDSDTSSVTGMITGVVDSPTAPFGNFQITDMIVSTAESTALSFCFVPIGPACLAGVNVTSNVGGMNVVMVTPGLPAPVVAGAFTQVGNDLQLLGDINVTATGLAVGQIPEGPFVIDSDPLQNDLPGTLTRIGDTFTLTIDLDATGMIDDPDTGVMIDFTMTGTIVATGQAPVVLPGDLDCSGVVDLDDAPLLVEALLAPGSFSGCDINRADVDENGATNSLDVAAFVAAVLGN
ncbi:MAG: hypothetical protein H6819_02775 [Phycisphaerales bacterium]|nr:hypothetical protein [Phycisphaerales bacterium]MCB9856863.1 hypothetical protein [Phycisphaerales bacterium]MCB9862010.1 hypothetical protein [Phycisphaerales bacterium]